MRRSQIGRLLRGRLRAHHVSDAFIDRHGEDAVQKGLVEYLRARARGVEVREPRAFVVQAAFRRAIDELRREARHADGTALEEMLESGVRVAAPAEEEALGNIAARDLQAAIDSLPMTERQVLALHYFDEVNQRRAAELLYMSERTFRRRLRRSLSDLARLLGAPAPEPGSHRGLEIGLAAWAGLGGARVVVSPGAAEHPATLLGPLRRAPGRTLDRLRGPGTRLAASEVPERVGALTAGPAGKVLGGCAGVAVVCALSGVLGPGLDLGGAPTGPHAREAHRVATIHAGVPSTRPLLVSPGAAPPTGNPPPVVTSTAPSPSRRPASRRPEDPGKERQAAEAEEVEAQMSGTARAATEEEVERTATETEGTTTGEAAPARSATQADPEGAAEEEHQAEEQFRGPLAR